MASDPAPGKPGPPSDRHIYGPRAVGALLPAVTRQAYRKRSPAAATLMADWDQIVGVALGAVTVPRRLSAGSLAIGCSGPVAMELQHLAPVLIDRINAHFGRALVERLRFVQDGFVPFQAAAAAPKQPSPAIIEAADRAVADLPPGGLRDALASLGRAILTDRS